MPARGDRRGRGQGAGRRRPGRGAARGSGETLTVTVEAIASQGDGVAHSNDGRKLFIPFAAPGDVAEVAVGASRGDGFEARVLNRLADGRRQAPFCRHFGTCGGCAVQHLASADYREWKRGILVRALAQRGFDVPVAELIAVPRDSRRRVTFQATRVGARLFFGFAERRGHGIVDIEACPLLVRPLNDVIAPARALLAGLLASGEKARLAVQWVDGPAGPGLDVVLERDREPDLAAREELASFAEKAGTARISWQEAGGPPEPVAQRGPVRAAFGRAGTDLPPGAFLQPTAEGEAALRDLVVRGAQGAGRIAELFAGAGTFTFALAEIARVDAVDGDTAVIAALSAAAGRGGLGGRIATQVRDLAARPLLAGELAPFDLVVMDPPRAGALAQTRQVAAASNVRRVVMVSCSPATFARDARVLADGGFVLEGVTPVDQFPYTHHLECVGIFDRSN